MEVKLLRGDFEDAWNEPDNGPSLFRCYEHHYEGALPALKKLFLNATAQSITAEDGTFIQKIEDNFFIKDPYGRTDTYTYKEVEFLIDIWDKAQKYPVNYIIDVWVKDIEKS